MACLAVSMPVLILIMLKVVGICTFIVMLVPSLLFVSLLLFLSVSLVLGHAGQQGLSSCIGRLPKSPRFLDPAYLHLTSHLVP